MTGEFSWFDRDQKERDYIQRLLLREIFRNADEGIVFKGGTALQKVYGLERFSDDLDFTINDKESILQIDEALDAFSTNVCEVVNDYESERIVSRDRTVYRMGILHPESKSMRTVTVDITQRGTSIKPDTASVSIGGDSFLVYVMQRKEILAEKVRAIYDTQRNKARDLYDLWFLIRNNIDIDVSLISKKLKEVGKVRYSLATFTKRVNLLQGGWDDLGPLMEKLPDYKIAAAEVLDKFRNLEL